MKKLLTTLHLNIGQDLMAHNVLPILILLFFTI